VVGYLRRLDQFGLGLGSVGAVSWLLGTRLGRLLVAGAALLVTLVTTSKLAERRGAKKGAQDAKLDAYIEQQKKRQKGREASADEKRKTSGVSDSDVVERLRRRDGDWGRM
jgi:hypothetical protein